MEYLDFDIEVEAGTTGAYDVSVVNSPAGEAHAEMRFPYDRLELQNKIQSLQIALLRSGGLRRTASAEDHAVEQLGKDLFEALFAGDIESRLQVSRTIARREGRGVRIKLRISAPELLGLPWEYLYDSNSGDYLALAVSTPVVRYMPIAQPIQPLEVSPPLRILAMTAGPRDLGDLDAERERQRLQLALERLQKRGLVQLEWVPGESWQDLQEALWRGPWHVFHFIGHGGFNARRGTGVLYLTGEDGNSQELPAQDLARLLGDHDPLRLALLNSCETAQGTETDIFSSTAAALVRRGTPAVVAMQFQITDDAAIQFSRVFYAATASGMPVDSAVAEARKSVALQVANTYEWGTPVLFMRSPDGLLFKMPPVDETLTQPMDAAVAAVALPPEPTPEPSPEPTPEPSPEPTPEPSPEPTPAPTPEPAPAPAHAPARGMPHPQTAAPSPAPVPGSFAPSSAAPPPATHPPGGPYGYMPSSAAPYPTAHPGPAYAPTWADRAAHPQASARGTTLKRVGLIAAAGVGLLALVALLMSGGQGGTSASLLISPPQGPAGSSFTLFGAGFERAEQVTVFWGVDSKQLFADDEGSFQTLLVVRVDAAPGPIDVTAYGSSGRQLNVTFTVLGVPAVTSTPDQGDRNATSLPRPDRAVIDAVCWFERDANFVKQAASELGQATAANDWSRAYFFYDQLVASANAVHQDLATASTWSPAAQLAAAYNPALETFVITVRNYLEAPSDTTRLAAEEAGARLAGLNQQANEFRLAHPEIGPPCVTL